MILDESKLNDILIPTDLTFELSMMKADFCHLLQPHNVIFVGWSLC